MKILVKFPTKDRPRKFFDILDSLVLKTFDMTNTQFVITIDEDDTLMCGEDATIILDMYNVTVDRGKSLNKIHAINRDMEKYTDWDILMLMSDDMMPMARGYDKIIRDCMQEYFPDLDGVLYFSDGFTPLNTLPIMGRKYYDRFGYIYHPAYKSFFCDNEFHEVASIMGKHASSNLVLFKHLHPANTGKGVDDLYIKNQMFWAEDEATWKERRSRSYDLCIDLQSL